MQRIDHVLTDAARAIARTDAGNPRFEAELLLAHVLARPRVFLFTHPEHAPHDRELSRFDELLERRLAGEPLQYVLGTAAFRDLTLKVEPGVLIPRSETEILVEIAWQALARRRAAQIAHAPQPGDDAAGGSARAGDATAALPWVIDVGVGSGAILLGLMDEARRARGPHAGGDAGERVAPREPLRFRPMGIDIAAVPLRLTAENALLNHLPIPRLVRGDLLRAVDSERRVAAILSNPPYIATDELRELPREIREHEPMVALDGGPDGLDVLRELLDQALAFIVHGALLCVEIGGAQDVAVRRELGMRGLLDIATIHPDLAGRPRVVLVDPLAAGLAGS
jgi:release factor glutamine methyltransferase